MGIDYSVAIGVGVDDSEITYEALTDYVKNVLQDILFENASVEELEDYRNDDELFQQAMSDLFDDIRDSEDFLYQLGLSEYEGNLYSGWIGHRGVGVSLNIDTIKEDVERAKQEFKKIVNLEPILFGGVLVS